MQCQAKSKQSGQQCRRHAVPGRNVCAIHGGKTPRGIASPQHVHGRYSKSLPTQLAATYEAIRSDPELLNLSDDLAALDAVIARVAGRLGTGEAGDWVQRLVAKRDQLQNLLASGQTQAADGPLRELFALIDGARSQVSAEIEFASLLDQRRKLVEAEQKRRVSMGSMLTVEQGVLMLSTFVDAMKRHVTDRKILMKIAADFEREGVRLGLSLRE